MSNVHVAVMFSEDSGCNMNDGSSKAQGRMILVSLPVNIREENNSRRRRTRGVYAIRTDLSLETPRS